MWIVSFFGAIDFRYPISILVHCIRYRKVHSLFLIFFVFGHIVFFWGLQSALFTYGLFCTLIVASEKIDLLHCLQRYHPHKANRDGDRLALWVVVVCVGGGKNVLFAFV